MALFDYLSPLVRIEAPHFCCGLIIGQRAPPIIAYMKTWTLAEVLGYCQRKGWSAQVLS